jgi:hypothetical protein
MNRELFAQSMAYMCKIYGHKIDGGVMGMYWQIMQEWPDDAFKRAVQNIVSNFRPTRQVPFPIPADFVEQIGEGGSKRAQNVVAIVQKAMESAGVYSDMDFGDPALHATIERFGGWVELCRWTYDDWRFRQKEFQGAYEAAVAAGATGSTVLAGLATISEAQGNGLPDTTRKAVSIRSSQLQKSHEIEHISTALLPGGCFDAE